MDSLFRDVSRLNLIYQMPIAQEALTIQNHVKDFVYYYFSRFVKNVHHIFNDFSSSEIADFNAQQRSKIDLLVKYPGFPLGDMIVPIPPGMIRSYKQTIEALCQIFNQITPTTLRADLEDVLNAMGKGRLKTLNGPVFGKSEFDQSRVNIGKLFGKVGLTHSTAVHALVSKSEIKHVNDSLLVLTKTYYADIVALGPLLDAIERKHAEVTWSKDDQMILAARLMTLAYRLSIMAVVMDHVQEIEHAFVKDLKMLLTKLD